MRTSRRCRATGHRDREVGRAGGPGVGRQRGTLGNWCAKARREREHGDGALSETERAELARFRKENTELRMQRDVLKRSVVLWVKEAMK